MTYTGENKRKGRRDRRPRWPFWVLLTGVSAMVGATGVVGGRVTAPEPVEPDPIVIPEYDQELEGLRLLMIAQAEKEPEERIVFRDRFIKGDSFPYFVASPPETLPAPPPLTVTVYMDTLYVYPPPNIITIPVQPRTFWDAETYQPSIGNINWALGGTVLGYILRGLINTEARACVVINSEETCSNN